MIQDTFIEIELDDFDKIFSYKVTALNEGGESFPSEILSVGIKANNSPIALIVNSFDRVCGPEIVDGSQLSGVAYWKDMGVSYKRDIGLTGVPYNYSRNNPWKDDDNPGWGASFSDWEGKVIPGNSFDFPLTHGKAIINAGYSFVSTSDEVFSNDNYDISKYNFFDIIFGEEKTTKSKNGSLSNNFKTFTTGLKSKIKEIAGVGGNIFLSGAYIGFDNRKPIDQKFVNDVLHYEWRTNYASKSGQVYSTDYSKDYFNIDLSFNTKIDESFYMIESPDGIEPSGDGAISGFRYKDTGVSAGVLYKGKYKVLSLGFPFETIKSQTDKNAFMKQIIMFFEK